MIKLFKYELKRLILNKFFLGLLVLTILYSRNVMTSDIILGISNTAPFSGWSYGMYLSKVLPILLITLLFFISFLYSKSEKKVSALTKATAINPIKFQLLRFGTIFIAFIFITMVPIIYSLAFYKSNFKFSNYGSLILPILVTILPSMIFIFGLGVMGGRFHQGTIFALMLVVVVISYIPLPYCIDLLGSNFYKDYPQTLNTIEPTFLLPASIIISKLIFSIIGIMLIISSTIQRNKYNNKGTA